MFTLCEHVASNGFYVIQAVMGNGPACEVKLPFTLIDNGFDIADPCQLSTIMREVLRVVPLVNLSRL